MADISHGIRPFDMVEAALCASLASYTFIIILDHEIWMKEWGGEHKAFSAVRLRMPMLSAATAMGIGGITIVHHIALASLDLDGLEIRFSVWFTIFSTLTAFGAVFITLLVARRDVFAGIERVDRLKEIVTARYTIGELKNRKGLGTRVAFAAKLEHILGAGIILGTGIFGCWCISVAGLEGDFIIVWKPWSIVSLAIYQLALGVTSCWIMFRLLVWKPANEMYRMLCALFMAFTSWSIDYLGDTYAIHFEGLDGRRTPTGNFGWSMRASTEFNHPLFCVCVFGAIAIQYIIALELRMAYCDLQDANLDLQLMTGVGGTDSVARRSSTNVNNRKLARPRRRASTFAQPMSTSGAANISTSSFATGNRDLVHDTSGLSSLTLKSFIGAMSAKNRLMRVIRRPSLSALRNTRVQPMEVYKPTTDACGGGGGGGKIDKERLKEAIDDQPTSTSEPRETLKEKGGGVVGGL